MSNRIDMSFEEFMHFTAGKAQQNEIAARKATGSIGNPPPPTSTPKQVATNWMDDDAEDIAEGEKPSRAEDVAEMGEADGF